MTTPPAIMHNGVRYIRADLVERTKSPDGVPSEDACLSLTCDCKDGCKRAKAGRL